MQDVNGVSFSTEVTAAQPEGTRAMKEDVVSTHVLVDETQIEKLRELSRRTRVAQSEYLREAVDDLLAKYNSGEKKL